MDTFACSVLPRFGWFPSSESSSDDSSLDSAARRKKQELKAAAANWVAPTSTGVTNSEAIVQYDDLKTGKIYSEMEVIPVCLSCIPDIQVGIRNNGRLK